MKLFKGLALFGALLATAGCSASGNASGNGGSDAFLTAIGKYSKAINPDDGQDVLHIKDGGKILQGTLDMDGMLFTFVKSVSATVGTYTVTVGTDSADARVTLNGAKVNIQSAFIGSEHSGNQMDVSLK